jgi:hypothetical protein
MNVEVCEHGVPVDLFCGLCEPPLSRQEGGNHYMKMKIQVAEYCLANMTKEELTGVLKWMTTKYIWRDKIDWIEDAKKAKHYIEMIIDEMEKRG